MRIFAQSKRAALLAALAAAASGAACSDAPFVPIDSTPALDARLRQAIAPWGVVPILPVNAPDPAMASLGKMLFFDKRSPTFLDLGEGVHQIENAEFCSLARDRGAQAQIRRQQSALQARPHGR